MSDWDIADIKFNLKEAGFSGEDLEMMSEMDLRAIFESMTSEGHLPDADVGLISDSIDLKNTQSSVGVMDITENVNSNEEMVHSFCEMTGSDINTARSLLEACSYNIDTAITMHMDQIDIGQTDSTAPRENPQIPQRVSGSSSQMTGGPMAGMMRGQHPLMTGDPFLQQYSDQNMQQHLRALARGIHYAGFGGGDDDDDHMMGIGQGGVRAPDEYDEHGVRRPDPVRVSRLLSDGMPGNDFARADAPDVDWLFPPPNHLSFPGSFQECKQLAKQDKKWILVNIQHHQEFPSQQLNRDTWVDETVQEILRENFVFWQRGHTSQDARTYMSLYQVSENDLPHIGIIDPRTGAKTSTIKGFMEPRILTQTLFEYFDENSFDSVKGGRERVFASSSSAAADKVIVIDDSDDDEQETLRALSAYEAERAAREKKEEDDVVRGSKKPREGDTATTSRIDHGPMSDEPAGEP
jgi:hypothetical protein